MDSKGTLLLGVPPWHGWDDNDNNNDNNNIIMNIIIILIIIIILLLIIIIIIIRPFRPFCRFGLALVSITFPAFRFAVSAKAPCRKENVHTYTHKLLSSIIRLCITCHVYGLLGTSSYNHVWHTMLFSVSGAALRVPRTAFLQFSVLLLSLLLSLSLLSSYILLT